MFAKLTYSREFHEYLKLNHPCPCCKGSGEITADEDQVVKCRRCGGTGNCEKASVGPLSITVPTTCPDCYGKGKKVIHQRGRPFTCPYCKGSCVSTDRSSKPVTVDSAKVPEALPVKINTVKQQKEREGQLDNTAFVYDCVWNNLSSIGKNYYSHVAILLDGRLIKKHNKCYQSKHTKPANQKRLAKLQEYKVAPGEYAVTIVTSRTYMTTGLFSKYKKYPEEKHSIGKIRIGLGEKKGLRILVSNIHSISSEAISVPIGDG